MAKTNLEQRVTALEAELRRLQESTEGSRAVSKDDWKLAVKKYAGDKDLRAVFAEAKKLREADRKRNQSSVRKRGSSR